MSEYEEMVEDIATEIYYWNGDSFERWQKLGEAEQGPYLRLAKHIISNVETPTCRLAVVVKEVKLPKCPHISQWASHIYETGQQDMIKASFAQEVRE